MKKQQGLPPAMPKTRLTREETLAVRPVRNQLLAWEEARVGELRIKAPRPKTWIIKLFSKYANVPLYKEIILEELGRWTFLNCDGEKTVKEIIIGFAERYNINIKEAEISILEYLKQLARRNLIGFAVGEHNAGTREKNRTAD